MFYFKLIRRTAGPAGAETRHTFYREYLKPEQVGETIAAMLKSRSTVSVAATRITQKTYLRRTR